MKTQTTRLLNLEDTQSNRRHVIDLLVKGVPRDTESLHFRYAVLESDSELIAFRYRIVWTVLGPHRLAHFATALASPPNPDDTKLPIAGIRQRRGETRDMRMEGFVGAHGFLIFFAPPAGRASRQTDHLVELNVQHYASRSPEITDGKNLLPNAYVFSLRCERSALISQAKRMRETCLRLASRIKREADASEPTNPSEGHTSLEFWKLEEIEFPQEAAEDMLPLKS